MKRTRPTTEGFRQSPSRHTGWTASRRGFTLVEVLVVLAILVILFGLLFAPMMAGMDMVTQGRIQARLQETAREAAERMRRELANAMYVYPPPTYTVSSGAIVTDYSQIYFVPAATDSEGNLVTPRRPRLGMGPSVQEYEVIRYFVKPPDTSRPYDETNPFVLTRQEGVYHLDPATGDYVFGSLDADGNWVVGRAESENAITPKTDYDIPATTTVCLEPACRRMEVGYVSQCPGGASHPLAYLHDDVKFQPERIVGEPLEARQDNTIYEARHGNWMGERNNGTTPLTASLSTANSELQPRLLVYRWNAARSGYTDVALDSTNASTPALRNYINLSWNSTLGSVQVGQWRTVRVHVDPSAAPAPGEFYEVEVDETSPGSGTYRDSWSSTGTLGTINAPVVPIYPNLPTSWDEPRMPIGFRIDPQRSDSYGTAAKIVPQSTRVTMQASAGAGVAGPPLQYTRVDGSVPQSELGRAEYSEYMPANQLWAEVRFARYMPPSPADYPWANASFDIYISYYYRRNFLNDAGENYRDDVMYADYSTGEIINITLIPQRFVELQPYREGETIAHMVVPPDRPLGGVPVRTKAVVQNARR